MTEGYNFGQRLGNFDTASLNSGRVITWGQVVDQYVTESFLCSDWVFNTFVVEKTRPEVALVWYGG